MRFNSEQILSFRLDLRAQNPGLRDLDLKLNTERCSDRINMLKQGRKTPEENKLSRRTWANICIPELREIT